MSRYVSLTGNALSRRPRGLARELYLRLPAHLDGMGAPPKTPYLQYGPGGQSTEF